MKPICKTFACCCGAWIVGTLLLVTGCRSHRAVVGTGAPSALRDRYAAAVAERLTYDNLQSRVTLRLGSTTLKGTLRMEAGRRIMLAVNAPLLGFEVARVEMEGDSVWMINKMEKSYAAASLADLRRRVGGDLTVEALQCLMTGRMYLPNSGPAEASDFGQFTWTAQADGSMTGLYSQGGQYTLTYVIGADDRLREVIIAVAARDAEMRWSYADYAVTPDGPWPGGEVLAAQIAERSLRLELSLGTPTTGIPLWTRFTPSRSYREVSFGDLLDALKKR